MTSKLIKRASAEWRSALIDVGGRNPLLYFRPVKNTLNVDDSPKSAFDKLLSGEQIALKELFPERKEFENASKSCAVLAARQRLANEEFGVPIAFLAFGMATWDPDSTASLSETPSLGGENRDADVSAPSTGRQALTQRPNAPVLLRPIQIERKRGAQDSWQLQLIDDALVNGVLVHVMNRDRIRIDEGRILEIDDGEAQSLVAMVRAVEASCADIEGFQIDPTALIGLFSYQNQAMVADIDNLEALESSELIAALAGDAQAVEMVRAMPGEISDTLPDYTPVSSEYLILDADSSQAFVVNAACAGRNLVVEGPPGTGKSQTIANLIAALIAEDKRVLFVAQKKAAITAVVDRLGNAGLGHVVMDAFSTANSRRHAAVELRVAIEGHRAAGQPQVATLERTLQKARDVLVAHKDAVLEKSYGWGVTVFDIQSRLLATNESNRSDLRISTKDLVTWDEFTLDDLGEKFDELWSMGALESSWQSSSYWNSEKIRNQDQLRVIGEALLKLESVLIPDCLQSVRDVVNETRVAPPKTCEEIEDLLTRLEEAGHVASRFPLVQTNCRTHAELIALLAATDRRFRKANSIDLRWSDRRRLKKEAARLVPEVSGSERIALLHKVLHLWNLAGDSATPFATETFPAADMAWKELFAHLDHLQLFTQGRDLKADVPLDQLSSEIRVLRNDPSRFAMPRAFELKRALIKAGLKSVLEEVAGACEGDVSEEFLPSEMLKWIVLSSLFDQALIDSPSLGQPVSEVLNDAVSTFQVSDQAHLEANAARVKRQVAAKLTHSLNDHPDQYAVLKKELSRKRNYKTIRALMDEAPDVMLSAKPVWSMSPLAVSRLLPSKKLFDVVVFDEASQIRPADAIPALMRAERVVVAGDSRQLPPTSFFSKVLEDSGDAVEEDLEIGVDGDELKSSRIHAPKESYTRDTESILAAFDLVLAGQSRRLLWHYRSHDERLIAVSNEHVYSNSLTTFPSADTPDAIRHVVVPYSKGISGKSNSPEAEVTRVVDLVREHLQSRSDESLGVITFGIKHKNRIDTALRAAAQSDQLLSAALEQSGHEPFFVKNIETVQGDERDAIILTAGYGKEPDGKLRLFWGPLLQEGGERRLNVAISRSKRRMTLVTSFDANEVSDDGHASEGFKLMYRFIRFMASGGEELTGGPDRNVELNPFEIDVRDRLEAHGLKLDPQYGVGRYRIDFAVRHPAKPGKHILAIEADGASYHSGHTARERDRLRQTLLEARGWKFARIWSTDWFRNPGAEIEKVLRAFEDAVQQAPNRPFAEEAKVASWTVPDSKRKFAIEPFPKGLPITEYSEQFLRSLLKVIRSDDVLRSHDDEFEILFNELGYQRRGPKIVKVLGRIIRSG